MDKKLDELKKEPKNPNSPESQAFLKNLQQQIKLHREKMKTIYQSWIDEDSRNENK